MNEQEIRTKYAARKCETQMEFDRVMNAMNVEQEHLNHPSLDRERELVLKRTKIEAAILGLRIQLMEIQQERINLEQERKEINRVFHDLKHELIMMNPKEDFEKKPLVELA